MPETLPPLLAHASLIAALVGACVGSFLSLITYRFIHEKPMLTARSACTSCGKTLGVLDLVPILSWVFLRARARCCGARISIRYPLIELACALTAAWLVDKFGVNLLSCSYVLMAWCICGLILADLEAYVLPDILLIPLALAGILHVVATDYAAADVAASAAVAGALAYSLHAGGSKLLGRPALGLGDVKLIAVAGLWLAESTALVPFLFFSGLLGIICALIWRMLGHGTVFPFGPALLIALMACVIFPQSQVLFWSIYR